MQLEYLKCTTTDASTLFLGDPSMPLLSIPFVVVLIDAGAYSVRMLTLILPTPRPRAHVLAANTRQWSHELFDPGYGSNPGSLAAVRLRNEVTKYVMEHPEIPITARIIARVFVNEGGKSFGIERAMFFNGLTKKTRASFRADFNGTMPLFDFIDVGAGKERADEKIRGM